MTKEQLKALFDYVQAVAEETTVDLVGLAGSDDYTSYEEKNKVIKVFGFDPYGEEEDWC